MTRFTATLALLLVSVRLTSAQQLNPELQTKITQAIQGVIAKTGVPSASVGIVQNGEIVFNQAFGDARLVPPLQATAAMSYPIGSISKQFTATCLLLLQQDGKLTLDDKVARWFPNLTRARDITLRELLSHTSGYEDYAPQDYTIPAWMHSTDPTRLVTEWAGKPLDFEPGTAWQYSNTNFVLAALIIEQASGIPYFRFLKTRVLEPLALTGALNLDTDRNRVEPQGYERRALAPLRPAILEAPGWYYGDASLAMPVADLLKWDLSIINRTLLKPASYATFETEVKLKDGTGTGYGLGIDVLNRDSRRILAHSGEVGGFVAQNTVWPDDKVAIAVLTNQEASPAASAIANAITPLLFAPKPASTLPRTTTLEDQVKKIIIGLQAGILNRALFTPDANFYFSPETLEDFSSSLKPLGAVTSVVQKRNALRGGMTARNFEVAFASGTTITLSTYWMKDSRLEQFLVEGKN